MQVVIMRYVVSRDLTFYEGLPELSWFTDSEKLCEKL